MNDPTHPTIGAILSMPGLAALSRDIPDSTFHSVQRILGAVREHLGMDVAFVSESAGRERPFRHVDAKGESPIRIGDSLDLSRGYCQHVVEGSLPEFIVDTADHRHAMSLPEPLEVPIGSHISIPIRLKDGRVYGTFCCFNFLTDRTLTHRDLQVMRAFADIAAYQIDFELGFAAAQNEKNSRVLGAIETGQPHMVFQPLFALPDLDIVGVECLSRFDVPPFRTPDRWFAEADEAGHGVELELQAFRNALFELHRHRMDRMFPIWLNVSARTIIHGDLLANLQDVAPSQLVLELTEHEHIEDYTDLLAALRPLRALGMRVAIDDAGAGDASMSHILNIEPDFIKLDLSLTRHIDLDGERRALAVALTEFGRQTGAAVVAEGVESVAELNALRGLGVDIAQGFFLSKPLDIDALSGPYVN